MILSAQSIKARKGMIEPFLLRSNSFGMSHGLSCAGYDVRIAQDVTLLPQGFSLASTIEQFNMPLDVLALVKDKSTWARRGLAVQNTVLEPGWKGYLTMELSNHGTQSIQIVRGMPIAQIVFMQLDQPTEMSYSGGKYDNQPNRPVEAIMANNDAEEDEQFVFLPNFLTNGR